MHIILILLMLIYLFKIFSAEYRHIKEERQSMLRKWFAQEYCYLFSKAQHDVYLNEIKETSKYLDAAVKKLDWDLKTEYAYHIRVLQEEINKQESTIINHGNKIQYKNQVSAVSS